MRDDQLDRLLKSLDIPADPDPAFADRLHAQLTGELTRQAAPGAVGLGRIRVRRAMKEAPVPRAVRTPLRPIQLFALLAVTGLTAGALLVIGMQRTALACTPQALPTVRAALMSVAGYSYRVTGTAGGRNAGPVVTDGRYAAPDHVSERYLSEDFQEIRSVETIRIGERLWWRTGDDSRVPGWREPDPHTYRSPENPFYTYLPRNPAVFLLDGSVDAPDAAAWDVQAAPDSASGSCVITSTRTWSAENGAVQVVTASVDTDTALVTSIRDEWRGFVDDMIPQDRSLETAFDYSGAPPAIDPPSPGAVGPTFTLPPGSQYYPPAVATIRSGETATLADDAGPYARLTVVDVEESPSYPGTTAIPGEVYMSIHLRVDVIRNNKPFLGSAEWGYAAGAEPYALFPPPPGLQVAGKPFLPTLLTTRAGAVIDGWIVIEVPASGRIVMRHGEDQVRQSPDVEIILRER